MTTELRDDMFHLGPYQWNGKPVGGRIKSKPSDFIVIELDNEIPVNQIEYEKSTSGLFLVGNVWKRKIDHSKMLKNIAKTFKVNENDVSTGGIKDAFAETTQLFSVYQPRRVPSDPFQPHINIEFSDFRYARERIFPGSMSGNYFDITIRDCKFLDMDNIDAFGQWAETGILNYYGYQRFGSSRPITAQMGRLLIQGEFEKAIDVYLGAEAEDVSEDGRTLWRETNDPELVLLNWTNIPQIEKEILIHLTKRKRDFKGAVNKFPPFLLRIFRSAFISAMTNDYLSRRGLNDTILKGERENNNNIEIALPSKQWKQPLNEIWEEVFLKFSIDINEELCEINHTSRYLKSYVKDWEIKEIEDEILQLSFKLGTGCYATTVLRELMQAPPTSFF